MSETKLQRRLFYLRHLLINAFLVRRGPTLCTLGETRYGCSWTFCPDGLNQQSVVYSGGVGRDVTFERALVDRFGCSVVLMDPSPTGLKTMSLPENQNPRFEFLPVALAKAPGTLRLSPPLYPEEGSWFAQKVATDSIEVRCLDLRSIMASHGHSIIDLLKLDIEGSELGVIDQIVDSRLAVRQILVEFHEGLTPGVHVRHVARAMFKLLARGYKLVAKVDRIHIFLRQL